tara:strand:+ start:4398 stop:5219 length:822 start_codon:yes stop_codon:yes gene_type:complete
MTDESNVDDTTPTPASEPQSLQDMLPAELKDINALKDFKTAADLAKSYVNTKEKIGSMVTIPGDDADGETRAKFYNRIGRPETIDGYDFAPKAVEGLEGVTAVNDANVKAFKEKAHELGLTKKQANGMMDHVQSGFSQQLQEQARQLAESADKASKELRTEWGVNYDKNMGNVDTALSQFFSKEDGALLKQASAQYPGLMKSLSQIGSQISETPTSREGTMSNSAPTREDAKAEIQKIQGDKEHPYWNKQHPNHKQAAEVMNQLYKKAYDNVE